VKGKISRHWKKKQKYAQFFRTDLVEKLNWGK
jgi:hypothetical protein